jgi:hypothetical protein
MTQSDAIDRLVALIGRGAGEGPHLVGVLIVDKDGAIGVSMDAGDEADVLMMGIRASRKAGPVVVDAELGDVAATLETVR